MAINDMYGKDGFDADQARYERMNRLNHAEFAPGMGEQGGQDSMQDPFGGNDTENPFGGGNPFDSSNPFESNGGGNPFGGGSDPFGGGNPFGGGSDPFGGGGSPFAPSNDAFGMPQQGFGMTGMQQPNPQDALKQYTSEEDKIFAAIGTGIKSMFKFIQDMVNSAQYLTPAWYVFYGSRLTKIGGVAAGIGVVLSLFKVKFGTPMLISGCLTAATGLFIMVGLEKKAKECLGLYKDSIGGEPQNTIPEMSMDDTSISEMTGMWGNDESDDFNSNSFEPQPFSFSSNNNDDEDNFGDDDEPNEDEDLWGSSSSEPSETEPQRTLSPEEALQNLHEIPTHMYTRQYLYDTMTQVMPEINSNFSVMKEIPEDDANFLYWNNCLRDAAEICGCKEDAIPELIKLQETMFTIIVTCTRPSAGFKAEAVAKEIEKQYAYDAKTGHLNPNVFSTAITVAKQCIITIFTGVSSMVSLKDMLIKEKKWVLDTKTKIPVIIGIDQVGSVIKADMSKLESIIISGMPRSGKSWFVKAVLTQMCAFCNPNELNFYICDPKDDISDFLSFKLPHVKKFVSGDNNIVETLRKVVRQEGARRKSIIGSANCVNIWDFKEAHPEVDLPILYVVIDEVVTLAERMEKETKQEFQDLLVELISQLPAVGIRAFLIPHVIKNEIIKKTATDLVPCKISIMGDADHIEKTTGAKPKDFPYKLTNKGDMAVKLTGFQNVMYVHAPVISTDNGENDRIFNYMRVVWNKIEPNQEETERLESEVQNQIAQQTVQSGNFGNLGDVDDLFGNDSIL